MKKKKKKKKNNNGIHFETATYMVPHKRSNITAPFKEHLQFREKSDFYAFTMGQTWQNKINKIRIRALYIFNLLYTGCCTKGAPTLLLLRSI